ncbi:MAG: hypothetical protein Q7T26_00120 [Dehalococcoidia bacterium]|nr:hypothetical protein [Dehalococcoidia bacterium]
MLVAEHTALLVAVVNSRQPGQDDALRTWLTSVHMPNMARTPGVVSGRLFTCVHQRYGKGQYVLLYELDVTDPGGFNDALERERDAEKARGEWRDLAAIVVVGIYTPMGPTRPSGQSGTANAMTVVITNCNDPARDAEFNVWYDTVHAPNVLKTPGVLSARRYVCARQRIGNGRYLALYELAIDDARTFNRDLQVRADEERAAGRRSPLLEMVVSGVYRPVGAAVRPPNG